MTVTVAALKQVKNSVIGNPLAKSKLVKDQPFVLALIDCLNPPAQDPPLSAEEKKAQDALRAEAAHVIASLSYGSDDALGTLLRSNVHHHFLFAMSHFTTGDSAALRTAFSRALRALASSTADIVGPSLWGLKPDRSAIRGEATQALEYMFQIESMDIYLPLLVLPPSTYSTSSITSTSSTSTPSYALAVSLATATAQMLATTLRSSAQRSAATEWLPPAERQRALMASASAKARRGWEKPAPTASGASPWVAKQLVDLVTVGEGGRERDAKLIEAALSALAALAHDNQGVAVFLGKSTPDRETPPPLATILSFTKSRSVDIQLAACLCVTCILRASPPSPTPSSGPAHPHISTSHGHPTSPSSPHGHHHSLSSASAMSFSSATGAAPSASASTSASALAHSFVHVPRAAAHAYVHLEEAGTRTVMNIVGRMLAVGGSSSVAGAIGDKAQEESAQNRTKACFILNYLVLDEPTLCNNAFDRGCLDGLGALIQRIAPPDPPLDPDWEEGEPESLQCLREASLTLLASLALHSDDIRRAISAPPLALLPAIAGSLRARRHVGTRFAAAQCVRAMSRSVSVLRTSIVDSGLGMDVLRMVMGQELGVRGEKWNGPGASGGLGSGGRDVGKGRDALSLGTGKEREGFGVPSALDSVDEGTYVNGALWLGEDRRVLCAALSAVCNIVNDFSPLRPIYLEENLMPRLVYIIRRSDDASLRLNALWAVKNLVRKTSTETKRDIMSHLGWAELSDFFSDADPAIQEQAFNLLRNLAENEDGIAMVFRSLPPNTLLSQLTTALRSPSPDVVLQAASALANLANGTHEQQDLILRHPDTLPALQLCLSEAGAAVRRPAVSCVLFLAQSNPRRRKEMQEAGIVGTLRRLCEWSGHGHGSGYGHGSGGAHGYGHGVSHSPTTGTGGGGAAHWSPARSPGAVGGGGVSGGTYGSWAGSGSLHAHAAAHSLAGHGAGAAGIGAGGRQGSSWGAASMGLLEDDKDVVSRARQALDWLEHGEMYGS